MLSAFCSSPAVATLTIIVCPPPPGTIIRIGDPDKPEPPDDYIIVHVIPPDNGGPDGYFPPLSSISGVPVVIPPDEPPGVTVTKIASAFKPKYPETTPIIIPGEIPKIVIYQPFAGDTGNVPVRVIRPPRPPGGGGGDGPDDNFPIIPTNFEGGFNGFIPTPPGGPKLPPGRGPIIPKPTDPVFPPIPLSSIPVLSALSSVPPYYPPPGKPPKVPPPTTKVPPPSGGPDITVIYNPPRPPEEKLQDLNRITQQDWNNWVQERKRIDKIKDGYKAKNCTPIPSNRKRRLMAGLNGLLCACPCCSPLNEVLDLITGKNFFKIPFTDFKIPRLDHLVDKSVGFDANRREGEKCGACEGTKKIPDPNNDTKKYEAVKNKIEEKAPELLKTEAKSGLGGTRTTMIQGSDVLLVGQGMNNNKAHEVVPGGSFAPNMKGGKIPQQGATPTNAVVGKQTELGWPQQSGNYTIKCANKFSMLAGAGGITLATPGPLTISAGQLKILGPGLSLGCASGPLALEGESVNIAGNTISLTPASGETFFKGNVSTLGNMTTKGHAHFESMSFVKGACVGTNKKTSEATANTDVLNTERATWGKQAVTTAMLDLKTQAQSVPADNATSGFKVASPATQTKLSNRMQSAAALSKPFESEVTGYIIPGTKFMASGFINGGPVTCDLTVTNMVELHNIPHIHGIPPMEHSHTVTVPDMETSAESSQGLRDKVLTGAHESGAPQNPIKDTASRATQAKADAASLAAQKTAELTKKVAQDAKMLMPPLPKLPSMGDIAGKIKGMIA